MYYNNLKKVIFPNLYLSENTNSFLRKKRFYNYYNYQDDEYYYYDDDDNDNDSDIFESTSGNISENYTLSTLKTVSWENIFSCVGEAESVKYLNESWLNKTISSYDNNTVEIEVSSVYFKMAVYILYIPIFLFAVIGNGSVCYIVRTTARMHTVTNYFIVNLAIGDLLMALFCIPPSFISIFLLGYWPFGVVLCHLVNYSQAVSILVSAYTLVAISIDRYIAIMWPLKPRLTKR